MLTAAFSRPICFLDQSGWNDKHALNSINLLLLWENISTLRLIWEKGQYNCQNLQLMALNP